MVRKKRSLLGGRTTPAGGQAKSKVIQEGEQKAKGTKVPEFVR